LLVEAFVPEGALVLGIDETLERRRGKKIAPKGIYRDPVRSSYEHFVKTSALRWVCVTLLAPVPWASRVWALPFLSTLAYSERYAEQQGKRHKKLTEWAWQLLLLVRSWHPEREIIAVADRTYASLKLLDRCRKLRNPITFVTRLRLDAALYEPAPPREPGQRGRPRLEGERLANLPVVAEGPATIWTPVTVRGWYGGKERVVELASDTAVWYHTGLPPVPLRWVLIRDPQEEFETQALLCTDLRRPATDRLLVCETLADGSHLSRGATAPGLRDPEAMVGEGHSAYNSGTFGSFVLGHAPRPPTNATTGGG
jgi:hypothetical protein